MGVYYTLNYPLPPVSSVFLHTTVFLVRGTLSLGMLFSHLFLSGSFSEGRLYTLAFFTGSSRLKKLESQRVTQHLSGIFTLKFLEKNGFTSFQVFIFLNSKKELIFSTRQSRKYADNPRDTAVFRG